MTSQTYSNLTMSCIVPPSGKVETVLKDTPLREAVKVMSKNNFSQIPIVKNDGSQRLRMPNVVGVLSWKEICDAMIVKNFDSSLPVSKFMDNSHQWCECRDSDSVTDVVRLLLSKSREYALVVDHYQQVCGLATYYDIAKQYIRTVEPFSIIESIEHNLRSRLGTLSPEELGFAETARRKRTREDVKAEEVQTIVKSVDDLEFSEYQELIGLFYDRLGFNCDLADLTKSLHEVNRIRNNVMHFKKGDVPDEDRKELEWLLKLLKIR